MRHILLSILIILSVFISGCGPIYNVSYEYKPPKTTVGNMCVIQCMQSKNQCNMGEKISNEACIARAHRDAEQEFAGYQAQQLKNNQKIKKSVEDFDKGVFCIEDHNHCNADYNVCYQSCGGVVLEQRTCVAMCDKA